MTGGMSGPGGDWLQRLMPQFRDQTKARLTQIEGQLKAVQDGGDPAAALKAICDVAHKISGTADTFGFPDLGASARTVEAVALSGADATGDTSGVWSRMEHALAPLMADMKKASEEG